MRLARRALVAALATMVLTAVASAQALRQENDPRNTAPTVGTGGSPGGPTGLFTIYDGQTLRRGEFTFSVAYSNYDRDPGNVDITEIPVSFQLGLGDHVEIFYNTDAYRGVKVNRPTHLSSFYLPNSQLFLRAPVITPSTNPLGGPSTVTLGPNGLRSGGAIVQGPIRVSGPTLPGGALFRPIGSQPFVQFPFINGPSSQFGLTGNLIAPPFVGRLGAPTGGDNGNWGAASNFPGYGSPYGSILPGIVLTTRTIPANLTFNTLVVPDLFTVAPVYLPDAPFINRLYGQSSFSTHTFGANFRLTEPDNPLSVNLIPMYRWYWDKADDADGFNQLQRGASPGGNFGDIGLFAVIGGRLSRSVHVAVNGGYFLNSNPKSEAMGDATLLDRPDEFITGIGFDFPINRHFQPMAELKTVHYVGGRTPNAFPNNPVDFLAGVRVFPRRWWGFSGWYRAHLNQQGDRIFGGDRDFPQGFIQSEDPHGFGFQVFAGHRNERAPAVLPNQPPVVTLSAARSSIMLAANCGPGQRPVASCVPTDTSVTLSAQATDPDGDTLLYTWSTNGGRIVGDGPNATLDLSGAAPGTYTVTVEVDDGCGCIAFRETTITVDRCPCEDIPPPPCPTVDVSCPDTVGPGQPITFTANVSGGDTAVTPTFNWTVSAGTIESGQGTSSITVSTAGLAGNTTVTATVEVGGYDRSCSTSDSCTTSMTAPPQPTKVDEYGNIRFNDEKARLDNYAIALQNEPGAQGYIVCYGGRKGRAGEAMARCDRAKNYLVNERQIDASRIVTLDGGYREELTVELWIVPTGATPPTASPTVDPSEVQTVNPRRPRRGRRGREDEE